MTEGGCSNGLADTKASPLHSNFGQHISTNVLGPGDSLILSGAAAGLRDTLRHLQSTRHRPAERRGNGDNALLRLSLSSMRFGSGPPSRPFDVPKQARLGRVTRSLQYFFSQHGYFAAPLLLCSSSSGRAVRSIQLRGRSGSAKSAYNFTAYKQAVSIACRCDWSVHE